MEFTITELPPPHSRQHEGRDLRGKRQRSKAISFIKRCHFNLTRALKKLTLLWRKYPVSTELLGMVFLLLLIILLLGAGNYLFIKKSSIHNQHLEAQLHVLQMEIREADNILRPLYQWRDLHRLQQKSRLGSLIALLAQLQQLFLKKLYFTNLLQEDELSPLMLTGKIASFELMREVEHLFRKHNWKVTVDISADGDQFRTFTLLLEPEN